MKRRRKKRSSMNRSQMMQAVRSEDTKPEMLVRRALFKAGFRYKLHRRDLPGSPDLFVLKYSVVVFVNGCFWHQHGCKFTSRPKSNPEFWNTKFDNNVVRDIKTNWELSLLGYRVVTVWECSIKYDFDRSIERLKAFIESDEETIEI
ncbi:very short patch repair endonuclease [Fibrobacter sp. UWB12]|uniref:very short patch repair endonuclease n=1 Tax=Fibrobacter sp. UWB12 TaxID=1896203 RepID=UPI000911FDF7|nr:very short patch repair endonuclease [Fibrobacter sp. UWB12]SHK90166.1 T/G mismatch-specific endonuclease [Fibrobacter sp. UWB12]